eukprot:s6521_g1.t1
MQCRQCGSYDVIYSIARGDTVCGNCGEVLEDRTMVTETSFVHGANGAARAVGGRIDFSVGLSFVGGPNSQEMLKQELANATVGSRMGYIADRLQLPAPIQEAGRRMYTLACSLNFNAGTHQRFTCAACLYVVCRQEVSDAAVWERFKAYP